MEREYLKPADIAARLGYTTSWVYKLIAENRIPHIRSGRSVLIPRRAWEDWLDEQNAQAKATLEVQL
jgi:excisionase family DNA binding protein